MITVVDEKTEERKDCSGNKRYRKEFKTLGRFMEMAQEIDKAIPILEKAAKMSKDGESYVLVGNLYLSEDRLDEAADAILKGLGKGKIKKLSPVYLTLGQVYFELQKFEDAKKILELLQEIRIKKLNSKQIIGLNILKMKRLELKLSPEKRLHPNELYLTFS